MAEGFDSIRAPQFFDFSQDLQQDENADLYFETDHENQNDNPSQDPLKIPDSEECPNEDELEFYSPFPATSDIDYHEESIEYKPRRSMSLGDLLHGIKCIENEDNNKAKEDSGTSSSTEKNTKYNSKVLRKTDSATNLNKNKSMSTRTSTSSLRRIASRENLNRLAQPKKYSSAHNLNQDNYVSMAEAVRKYQSATPTRFRVKPNTGAVSKLKATIPQSPALMAKNRHRTVHALSREEQERLEFEEAQRFKIRARPLNKRILQGPMKPLIPMEKKPVTVVEPFKITDVKKKVAEPVADEPAEFHAQPVPHAVRNGPRPKETLRTKLTIPQTPSFMKRYRKEPPKPQPKPEETKQPVRLERTVPVPFSFERRDQSIQKRKEALINKVFEEERKAREFHARPVPKGILSPSKSGVNLQRANSRGNITKSEENVATQFKAREPSVLYKKPFEPKKERHMIEISEFELNTEKRSKEREEFEQAKKEKEERIAEARRLEEQLRLQKEEEEVQRLRKETEYKARPVKKYKEVVIQPSLKITVPKTPKFLRKLEADKENQE